LIVYKRATCHTKFGPNIAPLLKLFSIKGETPRRQKCALHHAVHAQLHATSVQAGQQTRSSSGNTHKFTSGYYSGIVGVHQVAQTAGSQEMAGSVVLR